MTPLLARCVPEVFQGYTVLLRDTCRRFVDGPSDGSSSRAFGTVRAVTHPYGTKCRDGGSWGNSDANARFSLRGDGWIAAP
jgi:hypothetical protein